MSSELARANMNRVCPDVGQWEVARRNNIVHAVRLVLEQ